MNRNPGVELLAVIGALLLAFLLATSDDATKALLTVGILAMAWVGITFGVCWMVIQAKRGLQELWSRLLDGVAVETK